METFSTHRFRVEWTQSLHTESTNIHSAFMTLLRNIKVSLLQIRGGMLLISRGIRAVYFHDKNVQRHFTPIPYTYTYQAKEASYSTCISLSIDIDAFAFVDHEASFSYPALWPLTANRSSTQLFPLRIHHKACVNGIQDDNVEGGVCMHWISTI